MENLPQQSAPNLANISAITHGFFSREGGVSSGIYGSLNAGINSQDAPKNIAQNRALIATAMQVAPEALVSVTQIHSADCITLNAPWSSGDQPRADAIVTTKKGIAISVLTADCGPLLFCDPVTGVIGAAHAGWGGALKGIAEATIDAMVALGATPQNITAALGPCLQADKFEVTDEFIARFTTQDPLNQIFFYRNTLTGRDHFNMAAYLERRLKLKGLSDIHISPTCTYTDEVGYYSYRRATHLGEPDYGRQLAAIALK